MRYFFIASLLFFISAVGTAQSTSNWTLYVNKTVLLSASVDSMESVQLSKKSSGKLAVYFPQRDKNFKRTVMIMNEERNTLLHKDLATTCRRASFPVDSLLSASNSKPFVIYIADIPADPQKAMLVRMAPVAICKVEWK